MSHHRRRHAKGNRRWQNAKARRRVVGLGTAAGAALTFGMTPLAAVAPAHADLLGLLIDPIADSLSGAMADLGSLPSDLAAGVALPATLLHDLDLAWSDSPLGRLFDSGITASSLSSSGHGVVDHGNAETVAVPPAGSGGLAVNDGGAATATASATEPAPSADVAATYAVSSQWDGGFVADYTIDNSGSSALNDWQLQFSLPAGESITNVWNATLTQTGGHYVLTPDSYDSTIAPDGSVSVGFQATDTGTYSPPTQVTVDGQPVDSGAGSTTTGDTTGTTTGTSTGSTGTTTGDTSTTTGSSTTTTGTTTGTSTTTGSGADSGVAATYAVSSQWDGGFVADYTIDNSGSSALNDWQLQFSLPAGESITNVWNATLTQTGGHYVLTPDSYDSTIAPDGSVSVGFQATDTGTYSPPTQVTVDGQPVDSGAGSTTTGTSSDGDSGGASSSTGSTGGDTAPTGDVISAQYGTTTIENAYVVQNNAYNNSAGQSIDVTSTGFSIVNENGSASTDGAPLAYPSIYLGCAYGDCSPGSPLPEELSQIQSATSSIDYAFPSTGTYDASYDIWLNPTPITTGVNEQELMIWFDHQGPIQPVGSPVGDATIDGKDFVVWEGNNGSNDVISYVATSPISSWNNFNLLGFIDNMETHEAVNNSWYLTSIQAGFEPWNGSTGAAVDSFSASVNGVS